MFVCGCVWVAASSSKASKETKTEPEACITNRWKYILWGNAVAIFSHNHTFLVYVIFTYWRMAAMEPEVLLQEFYRSIFSSSSTTPTATKKCIHKNGMCLKSWRSLSLSPSKSAKTTLNYCATVQMKLPNQRVFQPGQVSNILLLSIQTRMHTEAIYNKMVHTFKFEFMV